MALSRRSLAGTTTKAPILRGKTLVMLINDPPVADPRNPARLDPAMFKGEGMTYYGRWTYKYEMAANSTSRPRASSCMKPTGRVSV